VELEWWKAPFDWDVGNDAPLMFLHHATQDNLRL
jgi:hypothetical protein